MGIRSKFRSSIFGSVVVVVVGAVVGVVCTVFVVSCITDEPVESGDVEPAGGVVCAAPVEPALLCGSSCSPADSIRLGMDGVEDWRITPASDANLDD